MQRAPPIDTFDASSAPDTSLDGSQFLPVTSDRCIGDTQQYSQVCLSQQVTLDLQDQPLEHGAICIGHATKLLVVGWCALYRSAHIVPFQH